MGARMRRLTSKSKSQVSVIHFIGAAKPWNNQSSPAFKKWLQQWYKYSQGKLIDVVLRQQKFPISINELTLPSASPDAFSANQINTPADLCDPFNYQHLSSKVKTSSLVWDATKESPPQDAPNTSHLGFQKKTI